MHALRGTTAFALVVMTASCGSDDPAKQVDAAVPPIDSATPPVVATWHQVEHLARPAINEALLITEAFNAGFNATAPSFAGVPKPTLDAVILEAKTVLQALYLGGCLINGLIPGITADTGVKPAGMKCHAIGTAIWLADNVTLTQASVDNAKLYADKVFGQFIPDVLRIDTAVTPSNYLNLCGGAGPLLCGGRFPNDDVVDITYNYLLNGAANYLTPGNGGAVDQQIIALTSDGVAFSKTAAQNSDTLSKPDATNQQQGHPDISSTFPYSAAPF
jgi:uncharacterized protein DUF4331